jgi:hypothetical protein
VSGAPEIIMAKLIAHDPDDVLRPRHAYTSVVSGISMLR